MLRNSPALYLLTILCAMIATPAQAVQRAFVASNGLNSNTAFNCDATHPCRWFYKAISIVGENGEIIALDTGTYGVITLTKSITLSAAPGALADITAYSNAPAGVTIATPGVNVVLRGLTFNGQGAAAGILMTDGAMLSIENCVISNFSGAGQHGVLVNATAAVRMVDTLVRDNDTGIQLQGGAITNISSSKFLGNNNTAIFATSTSIPYTGVVISDAVVSAGGTGIKATSSGTGDSRINMIRTSVTNNLKGIASSASAGNASVTLSDSMVTGNVIGYEKGAGGSLISMQNNTITDNGSNTGGALTVPVPALQ